MIHFLNDVLAFKEGAPIKDVTFLKNSLEPETLGKKTSLVDILCADTQGNTYAEKYEDAYLASMAQKYDEGEAKGRKEGEARGKKRRK